VKLRTLFFFITLYSSTLLMVCLILTNSAMTAQLDNVDRIQLSVRNQLDALIHFTPDQQVRVPISSWVDENHRACMGVGIEETLHCEIDTLGGRCKTQKVIPVESCMILADHYSSLYINRKAFMDWKTRDRPDTLGNSTSKDFHLDGLRNRFISLRRIIEMITPSCPTPWTSECEVTRITNFCTEYSAQTGFSWTACVAGILESWKLL
jgi:hypothetical protein